MDDIEDGRMEVIEVPKRPRTPVTLPPPDADMEVLAVLEGMGFLSRVGEHICRVFMQRHNNDVEQVVADLAGYVARTDELNREIS
jgi:hypothetical protein